MPGSRMRRHLRLASLLMVVVVAPVVSGCSTLGIAEVGDMDTMNRRLTTANSATNERLDTEVQQLNTTLDALDVQFDTLNDSLTSLEARVKDVRAYVEELNLSDISSQANRASTAADRAERQLNDIRAQHLKSLEADQVALSEQIKQVKASLEKSSSGKGAAKKAPEPAEPEPLPEVPEGG